LIDLTERQTDDGHNTVALVRPLAQLAKNCMDR